jgi:tRNA (guanine-N7-)-methyltransferase
VRKGRRLSLEQLQPYLLPTPEPPAPIDFAGLFGNDRPVEMEVGFGKGLFLLRSAQQRPEVNFVGVEIVRKYQLFTATRIAIRNLTNVRVACADARLFLRDCVPAACLQTLHVYFPDPWWKTRHHKRRLFTEEFARLSARVLRPGGVLSFASDVEDYAKMVEGLVATVPSLRTLPPPEPGTPAHDMDYLTNFERKFRKEGKPIYRMRWERVGGPG